MAYITGPVPERFERELTATPAEFERDLRKAWPAGVDAVSASHFRLHSGTTRLDIHIDARGIRRLGLFELPLLAARYEFCGGDETARRNLLTPLDRAMQRGGG
ncbi:hypothetical protein [Aromatoleum diolicum]|uniref:Polyhydroxyalkanoic acid system protein n=1 Tax=Aromatoleum diolicum TaxID=75796 RepID=A0ABX1Q8R3_9RHOO|nr:hypothetical protein [Aromatoleum diolicum]NMG73525.1 hypothetical protein [Aromatoleum diolicum]